MQGLEDYYANRIDKVGVETRGFYSYRRGARAILNSLVGQIWHGGLVFDTSESEDKVIFWNMLHPYLG